MKCVICKKEINETQNIYFKGIEGIDILRKGYTSCIFKDVPIHNKCMEPHSLTDSEDLYETLDKSGFEKEEINRDKIKDLQGISYKYHPFLTKEDYDNYQKWKKEKEEFDRFVF